MTSSHSTSSRHHFGFPTILDLQLTWLIHKVSCDVRQGIKLIYLDDVVNLTNYVFGVCGWDVANLNTFLLYGVVNFS